MGSINLTDIEIREYYNYVKSLKKLSLKELEYLLNCKDKDSRQKFINAYLCYVFDYADQIYSKFQIYMEVDYPFMDYVQDSILLLMELLSNNKISDIQKFSLAFYGDLILILEQKVSYLRKHVYFSKLRIVKNAQFDFYQTYHREPTVSELVKLTSLSQDEVINVLQLARPNILDFSEEVIDDSGMFVEIDFNLPARLLVEKCIGTLDEKERDIVIAYYGLLGAGQMNGPQIAKEYGVTKMRVSQIISDAREKMLRKNYRGIKGYFIDN